MDAPIDYRLPFRTCLSLGRSRWIVAALVLAAAHMLIFDRGLGGDGWASFALLESLADDGDLWLENNHRGVLNGLVPGRDGHLVSQYPPGILLLDFLPFAAGRLLDQWLPARVLEQGGDLPPVGRVPRSVFLSAALIVLARNVVTLLGLAWIACALLKLGRSEKMAAVAVTCAFFGGPMLFYSLVGMTHAPTFALASLLLILLVRLHERPGLPIAFAVGLVAGVAILVRYSAVALVVPAMLTLGLSGQRRNWATFASLGSGLALPLLALPLWWLGCYGDLFGTAYGGHWEITADSPWNVLFAPTHGLYHFHPALLFGTLGLLVLIYREVVKRSLGWGAISGSWLLAVAMLHGWWSEWANVGAYGQRFMTDAVPAFALGFSVWLAPGRARAGRAGACLAGCMAGYLLFFASVGGLVKPAGPFPWPQRLAEYSVLARDPPGLRELWGALKRASLLVRKMGA